MPKKLSYSDAPQELRSLIDELRENGDYLVIEDAGHNAVACLTPLPEVATEASRDKAAQQMRDLLDSFPNSSPYSEDETFQHIAEALTAIRHESQPQVTN